MEKKYEHVIVIGVDGAGGYFREADTPCFDRIFENGAKTYRALASKPTISAECWGSMLIGTSPAVHGLTNGIVSSRKYPLDSEFPTLFRRIREKEPDAELGSVCCWGPINTGIIEEDERNFIRNIWDDAAVPVIVDYIKEKKPEFLFVQFDSVDGAGHSNGYATQPYFDRITVIDGFLGQIDAAITDAGIADDTLFCVIADHGGKNRGHGGWTDEQKYVTFAARGKTVRRGDLPKMNVRDLSAIVLYALGIEAPDFALGGWTSQIPALLFTDVDTPYRDISEEEDALPRISLVHHTSELV